MATYDNKIWLLKNIRDAFIATDDTGLCEIVMVGEDFSKIFLNKALEEKKRIRQEKLNQPGMSKNCESNGSNGDYDDEREIITQYEIYPDMEDSDDDDMYGSYIRYEEYGGHRQRSNTSQWLDKKEQALKKSAKIKVVKWENMSNELTTEEISQTFSKVEIKKQEKKKSLLAEQLEKCPDLPHRHYLEYAKFDGTAQLGLPTKCFKIFMTMLPEKHQNYPIVVCVIGAAKIRDLIGFTCYKYSIEHPEITLGNVHDYGLCMADDDGEVDFAFPCLDANEPCSKFGFTCLGLVELNSKDCMNHATISLPEDGGLIGSLLFPKPETSHNQQPIASRHNTGGSNTSRELKRAMDVLNEGKLGAGERGGNKSSHIGEAPQYKTYRVQLIHKVRANTNVQLTISVDRIEVEPTAPHKHAFWTRSKYIRHSIDLVAWCQIVESKSSKTIIRIVYSPTLHSPFHDKNVSASSGFFNPNTVYKFHDFECDHDTAKEIVDKVNTILDLRNSPCRREYKTAKEKKMHARRSFNTKHMS